MAAERGKGGERHVPGFMAARADMTEVSIRKEDVRV